MLAAKYGKEISWTVYVDWDALRRLSRRSAVHAWPVGISLTPSSVLALLAVSSRSFAILPRTACDHAVASAVGGLSSGQVFQGTESIWQSASPSVHRDRPVSWRSATTATRPGYEQGVRPSSWKLFRSPNFREHFPISAVQMACVAAGYTNSKSSYSCG